MAQIGNKYNVLLFAWHIKDGQRKPCFQNTAWACIPVWKKIKHIFPQQLHVFLFQLIPIYVKEIFETHFLKKYLFPFCKSSVVLSDLFLLSYFRLSKELQRPRSGSLSSWHFKISDDLPRLPHKQAQAQTRWSIRVCEETTIYHLAQL